MAIKAAAGGGGYGMRVAHGPGEIAAVLEGVRRDAARAFGDTTVYVERFFSPAPRHVEIQILGDAFGNVVHLGERECSLQRRFQKIVEETPSSALTPALRQRMTEAAVTLARSMGYQSAGTIECLVDDRGEFYFLEMNTRLQVEHPVTEAVTGVDLVREMVRIAAGLPLSIPAEGIAPRGHAIEARVYAEDPARGFMPSPGEITAMELPSIAKRARRYRRAGGHEGHGLLRPDDRQDHCLGRRPRRGHRGHARGPGGNGHHRRQDQSAVPRSASSPATTLRRDGSIRAMWTNI